MLRPKEQRQFTFAFHPSSSSPLSYASAFCDRRILNINKMNALPAQSIPRNYDITKNCLKHTKLQSDRGISAPNYTIFGTAKNAKVKYQVYIYGHLMKIATSARCSASQIISLHESSVCICNMLQFWKPSRNQDQECNEIDRGHTRQRHRKTCGWGQLQQALTLIQ